MARREVGEPIGSAHRLHIVHVAAAAKVAAVRQVDLKLATASTHRVTEKAIANVQFLLIVDEIGYLDELDEYEVVAPAMATLLQPRKKRRP